MRACYPRQHVKEAKLFQLSEEVGNKSQVVICLPAQERRAGHAALHIIIQPPAVGEAEGEGEKLGFGGELVGNEQSAFAQQRLAILQCVAHVPRRMQHICSKENVIGAQFIALQQENAVWCFKYL